MLNLPNDYYIIMISLRMKGLLHNNNKVSDHDNIIIYLKTY